MHRRPPPDWKPAPGLVKPPSAPDASSIGDGVRAFLVSGGRTQFLVDAGASFDPRPAGIQLVAFQFVPLGSVGFVKQIRIGPYCPPVLVDPWRTTGATSFVASWQEFENLDDGTLLPSAGVNGIWETPFGWESFQPAETVLTRWEWHLRVVRNNIAKLTKPFDPADDKTWSYQPDIPVPRSAYNRGIPGAAPAADGTWGPNKMQATPSAPLETHARVPENNTVCLFVTWQQDLYTPRASDANGTIAYSPIQVYPLLPSYGQLHGYMQSTSSEAGTSNARFGWGG